MYLSKRDVWDYDNRLLITLCEGCHKSQHDEKKQYEELLLETLYLKGFRYDDLRELAFSFHRHNPFIKPYAICKSIGDLLEDRLSVEHLIGHFFSKDRIEQLKKEFEDG